jgi:hypothetical protein
VDKDAVLQPGKTQIDRLQPASQQVVLKVLNIIGSLGRRGIETPRLGLVQKIVNQVNELTRRLRNFSDHRFLMAGRTPSRPLSKFEEKDRRAGPLGDVSIRKKRPGFPVAKIPARRPQFPVIDQLMVGLGVGLGRIVLGQVMEEPSDSTALGR